MENPNDMSICAPKELDPRVFKKFSDAFEKAYEDPSFQELMTKLDLPPIFKDSESLKAMVIKDFDAQGKVRKELGFIK